MILLFFSRKCKVIAFPPIGTGTKSFPLNYAIRIALKKIGTFRDRVVSSRVSTQITDDR
ncbi:hypothetical protein IQ249_05570 [Lusitaniella coriacea LEGE 07157]|uniref:Uncharacterized protein n=1 Tax=Lusitaniella coriacea LEGE 07157 TaxID=945747 RepID=A0A8J7B145_9CYAN|nr:hypothetical protein [Lusitaniella coriacea]MBE9115365.1 hypothetical protein [Lusitaniella coriacea LEGE 07157]